MTTRLPATGPIPQAIESTRSGVAHVLAHLYCSRLSEFRWPRVDYGNAGLRAMSPNRRQRPHLRLTLACRN